MKKIMSLILFCSFSFMLLIPQLILAQNDIEISSSYSATWEMEYTIYPLCDGDTEFNEMLSSSGSFQVGYKSTGLCSARLRGVLEFDLSTVPAGIQSIQLSLTADGFDSWEPDLIELDGFSGNGTPDQADANVDNFLLTFFPPTLSQTVTLDVTSFVESLLNAGATYAGFTIRRPSAESFISFAGVGDLNEPLLQIVVNAPVANAGIDQLVFDEVTLNGSLSEDTDGTIESFEWQLHHRVNSAYDKNVQTENPTATVSELAPGFYDVILTVTDNHGYTDTDEMFFGAIGIKGDFDLDGDVDGLDLKELAKAFGTLF